MISAEDSLRVSVLSEALPYIQRFAGRRVVVKYGGAAMAHKSLQEAVFRDLALLACVGCGRWWCTAAARKSTSG